jgi:Ca2+-transporting ATPase
VAKESADLILLDSSFETIVATVREGRGIFDNIRKIILYLLSDSFEEIIAVVGTIILRLPLPISAVQILWINIISDGFPHLSLTVDPKEKGIMQRRPRELNVKIVSNWMRMLILIVSLSGGLMAWGFFIIISGYRRLVLLRLAAFATLNQFFNLRFSIRTLTQLFWNRTYLEING